MTLIYNIYFLLKLSEITSLRLVFFITLNLKQDTKNRQAYKPL